MRNTLRFEAALLAGLALALMGASDPDANPVRELILLWVNFGLLLGVIVYFARKPAAEYFRTRHGEVKGEIAEAQQLLADAERKNGEWQRRVAELDSELEQIRSTARQRAEDERAQILAEAQEVADRIQRDALASVEQEARRASGELRTEAADLASQMAKQLLDQNIGDDDRSRLIDEFIANIDSAGARN